VHMSAALVDGKVFTWGKGEECGHGFFTLPQSPNSCDLPQASDRILYTRVG